MRKYLSMHAVLAVGWTATGMLLLRGFPHESAVIVLGTLVLAETISTILIAMAIRMGRVSRRTDKGTDVFGRMLAGWVILCLLVLPLFHLQALPFFKVSQLRFFASWRSRFFFH